MVKLYYTPTSCGASSFICAFTGKLNFECEAVDLSTHKTESGIDFYTINPKGNVPTLVLDDGTVLNENISCLEYIADNGTILAPQNRTNERYVLRQILSFLASELHASIGGFFNPKSKDDVIREFLLSVFNKKMAYLQDNIILNNTFVYGNSFTIADAYLYIILSWTKYVGIDIEDYPKANLYCKRISQLDNVIRAKERIDTVPHTIC